MAGRSAHGIGLGLRRDLADGLVANTLPLPHFLEVSPENWMDVGGHWGKMLRRAEERYPLTCHGLSLSLGSPDELDWEHLHGLKRFLREHAIDVFSEHLSFCHCDNAHLYELLPIPFREDALDHVVSRIRQVQDFLERRIAIENVSYYTVASPEMSESEFIRRVVVESDCDLLLDVNNVYVNAFNHGYDAHSFLLSLPLERVRMIHMAGHEKKSEDLIIDTHGDAICDPVFDLFEWTVKHLPEVPVLLERDFQIPELPTLQAELARLHAITQSAWLPAHNQQSKAA